MVQAKRLLRYVFCSIFVSQNNRYDPNLFSQLHCEELFSEIFDFDKFAIFQGLLYFLDEFGAELRFQFKFFVSFENYA